LKSTIAKETPVIEKLYPEFLKKKNEKAS